MVLLTALAGADMAVATVANVDDALQTYIVTLNDDAVAPGVVGRALALEHGGQLGAVFTHALRGFVVTLKPQAALKVAADPRVKSIEEDVVIRVFDIPTGVDRIEADRNPLAAYDGVDTGLAVDIAVIDTGIDFNHPDLNVVARTDCTVSIQRPRCKANSGNDGNGHGTHVAGSAAARDNGVGAVGVAPGARLWAVKALGDDGSGFASWLIAAIDWVTANANQIEVANMSLGFEGSLSAIDTAIANSVRAGVVYTVAAGNSAADASTFSPANHPDVITVSAIADFDGRGGGKAAATCRTDVDDTLADFSNFGSVVEIAAPGTCIESTWPGGGYAFASGTSMASPHAAGAVGLYILKNGRDANTDGTINGQDVAAIRSGLVSAGIKQDNVCGFTDDSGDGFAEPLLFVNGIAFGGDGTCGVRRIAWTSPADGDVVLGMVPIAISVLEEVPGSSAVNWRVDQGAWTTASFDPAAIN
jgi:subtilisin family serine protease